MNNLSVSARIVITVIVITAAVLLSLAVFNVLEYAEIRDNLIRLGAVGGIIVVASTVVGLINRK